jgi:hypothetical protein
VACNASIPGAKHRANTFKSLNDDNYFCNTDRTTEILLILIISIQKWSLKKWRAILKKESMPEGIVPLA